MHVPPLWLVYLMMLTLTLPVTTPALTGFGIGWLVARRKGRVGAARVFKWCAVVLLPFWVVPAGFAGWWIYETMAEHAEFNRTHYQVREATIIDGVDIPPGTWVLRDDNGRLRGISLPEGTTLTANGASWSGEMTFSSPVGEPPGQLNFGTLAADAVIQGIPCRGGKTVIFESMNELSSCTLSRDATVDATLEDATGASRTQSFACRGGTEIHPQFRRRGEPGKCILAAPVEIGGVTCAEGAQLELVNAMLSTCKLAKHARFGPIDLPPGSSVSYTAAKPSAFRLPPTGSAVDGFGLSLPAGTIVNFCYGSEKLEQLRVDQTAYVAVEGLKVTGSIAFLCGASQNSPFQSGTLFEDSIVGGKQRQRGELVSRDDLSSK